MCMQFSRSRNGGRGWRWDHIYNNSKKKYKNILCFCEYVICEWKTYTSKNINIFCSFSFDLHANGFTQYVALNIWNSSRYCKLKPYNKFIKSKTQWGAIYMKISNENGWKIVYELKNITVKTNDLCTLKFRIRMATKGYTVCTYMYIKQAL